MRAAAGREGSGVSSARPSVAPVQTPVERVKADAAIDQAKSANSLSIFRRKISVPATVSHLRSTTLTFSLKVLTVVR